MLHTVLSPQLKKEVVESEQLHKKASKIIKDMGGFRKGEIRQIHLCEGDN